MPESAQLVLTHGTTDLQILLTDEHGKQWRAVPDKDIVRRFHAWLLEHETVIQVIDLPAGSQNRGAEALFTDWEGDKFALWLRDSSPDAHPLRDSQGKIQLVLPKIGPALKSWLAINKLHKVLVLSTNRVTDKQEPIATYKFLTQWLVSKNVPEADIQELIFLGQDERLENDSSPIDEAIAKRIEDAITEFYDRSAAANQRTLLIASMGGLPQIKPFLAEVAVLLAGDRALSLFKTEEGTVGLLPRTPIDAVRVRRLCLEQVRRGALLDAWRMAAPFHNDPGAKSWVQPLAQAARLLNGNPVGDEVCLPALQTLIDRTQNATCLLVAVRVEAALQTDRWLDAINGTLIFLEAAFRDAINLWKDENLAEYQPRSRFMRFFREPPRVLIDKRALEPWNGRGAGHLVYRANLVGEHAIKAWAEVLANIPITNLHTKMYEWQNINGDNAKLSDYRNYNTHDVMTQDEIDNALIRFENAELWLPSANNPNNPNAKPKPGKCFLNRPLVRDVICSFPGHNIQPLNLYENLLKALEACLIKPPHCSA